MMFRKLGLINKSQKGITMIELLTAFAVTGVVSVGITMTFYQVVTGSARSNNHMTAVTQIQNAGYWVSHDTQAAQTVLYDDPTTPGVTEFLTLRWTDWSDTPNTVRYILDGTELRRDDGAGQSAIAQFIDFDPENPEKTSFDFTDTNGDGLPDTLIFRVTATVGGGLQQQSETREYRIVPRALQ